MRGIHRADRAVEARNPVSEYGSVYAVSFRFLETVSGAFNQRHPDVYPDALLKLIAAILTYLDELQGLHHCSVKAIHNFKYRYNLSLSQT